MVYGSMQLIKSPTVMLTDAQVDLPVEFLGCQQEMGASFGVGLLGLFCQISFTHWIVNSTYRSFFVLSTSSDFQISANNIAGNRIIRLRLKFKSEWYSEPPATNITQPNIVNKIQPIDDCRDHESCW